MIRAACVLLALFASGIAEAQTKATYTALNRSACKAEPGHADARHEHGLVAYRCAGVGGWSVRLIYSGAQAAAVFSIKGETRPYTLRAPFDLGPRIEWRSRQGAAPHAAIVRTHVRTGKASTASTLAVLRLSRGLACLVAVLAPLPASDLNRRAQEIADAGKEIADAGKEIADVGKEIADAGGACAGQGPRSGNSTEFVTEIRSLNGL